MRVSEPLIVKAIVVPFAQRDKRARGEILEHLQFQYKNTGSRNSIEERVLSNPRLVKLVDTTES